MNEKPKTIQLGNNLVSIGRWLDCPEWIMERWVVTITHISYCRAFLEEEKWLSFDDVEIYGAKLAKTKAIEKLTDDKAIAFMMQKYLNN